MRLAVILTIGANLLLPVGCVAEPYEPYLRWEGRPAAATPAEGRVAIKAVVNMRAAKHGDRDLSNVGNIRGGSRVPDPIHIDSPSTAFKFEPQGLDTALFAFVKDALTAASIGTTNADDTSASAKLLIEIHEFWVDGAGTLADEYFANVSLVVVVQDPVTGQVRATLPVHGEGNATPGRHTQHDAFAKRAFRRALDEAYASLIAGFTQPQLRAALVASPQETQGATTTSTLPTDTSCTSGLIITEKTEGHCCWPGQIWANDRCNGRPARCPSGQTARGDRCVSSP
jgi:hypothetical protein